jgi:hypothetical protein
MTRSALQSRGRTGPIGGTLLAIVIAGYLLVAAKPAAADTTHQPSKAMYCAQAGAPPPPECLALLEAAVVDLGCGRVGGDIDLWFRNTNSVNAPRVITAFINGVEVYEDDGFAPPGKSVAEFRGLPDSQIRVVIGWAELVFVDKTVTVQCDTAN